MDMPLDIEYGIPLPKNPTPVQKRDLLKRASAVANSATLLNEYGFTRTADEEDVATAEQLALSYAADPEAVSKALTEKRMVDINPSIILAHAVLAEWGHQVVDSALKIRHMVTNKLLVIADDDNVKTADQLRALDMLGKISEVGLFSEKREVTVTHQSSDELRDRLRDKLTKLKDITPPGDIIEHE